jgi:hypothetical protein
MARSGGHPWAWVLQPCLLRAVFSYLRQITSVSNIYNTDNGTGTYLPDGWTLLQNGNTQNVAQNPASIAIAEDLTGNASVTAPITQSGAGFASQWNGNFVANMRTQLTQTSDSNVDTNLVASAIGQAFKMFTRRT